MKHLTLILVMLLGGVASCDRKEAEETPERVACRRACTEGFASCRAKCDEPMACGARCEQTQTKCLNKCAEP